MCWRLKLFLTVNAAALWSIKHIIANPRHKSNDFSADHPHYHNSFQCTWGSRRRASAGDSYEERARVFHPPLGTPQGSRAASVAPNPAAAVWTLPPHSDQRLCSFGPVQNHTSCSLLNLLYSPSEGFPTKGSEPANVDISAFSKSSASNGDLFHHYREGNNSAETN